MKSAALCRESMTATAHATRRCVRLARLVYKGHPHDACNKPKIKHSPVSPGSRQLPLDVILCQSEAGEAAKAISPGSRQAAGQACICEVDCCHLPQVCQICQGRHVTWQVPDGCNLGDQPASNAQMFSSARPLCRALFVVCLTP